MTPFHPSKPLRVALVGASGRMGRSIQRVASRSATIEIVCAIDRTPQTPKNADVVVDFSSDEGARRAAGIASSIRAALLVGTTGLSEGTDETIGDASRVVPAMKIPNSSLGIAILRRLTALAASILGSDAAVSIREAHHVHKKDAPSGTALSLAAALREAGGKLSDDAIQSIRDGEIVGDHRVTFDMPGEILSLEHRALDRDTFAVGALRIADWLRNRPAGLHTVDDWLSDLLLRRGRP